MNSSILIAVVLLFSWTAELESPEKSVAHSGGTDKCGCHTNRSTGEYHCHTRKQRGGGCPPQSQAGEETQFEDSKDLDPEDLEDFADTESRLAANMTCQESWIERV